MDISWRQGLFFLFSFRFCYILFHTLMVIRHMPDKEANLEKIIEQVRFINRSSYESLSTLIASNLSI